MDPIGFGLENFDYGAMARYEASKPIDATGGALRRKFNGVIELRDTLLKQKDQFVTQLTNKVLGYVR